MAIGLQPARAGTGPYDGVQDVLTAVLGAVVVVAIHLDGRAHMLNLPDSFFTPWHGVLYGGVTALSGWLLLLGRVHGRRRGRLLRMPAGYGPALAGAGLFLLGGGADLLWHTVFGIESGIEALLSPTHLWLFVAGALMLSGPIRAALARRDTGAAPSGPGLAAAVVAATSLAGLAGFALSFLSAYLTDAPSQPVPHFPEGTAEHAAVEIPASWGLASYLVTSLVLVVPLAYLILRWRLPFGTVTGYASSLALLAVTLADFHRLYAVPATALAGLTVDTFLLAARRRGIGARTQAVVAAALLPALAWSGQLVGIATSERLAWPVELVAGVVVLSTLLSALAAGFLAAPTTTPHPPRRHPELSASHGQNHPGAPPPHTEATGRAQRTAHIAPRADDDETAASAPAAGACRAAKPQARTETRRRGHEVAS